MVRSFIDNTIRAARVEIENFRAGRLKHFLPFWTTLTSDSHVLACISGVRLKFIDDCQHPTLDSLPYRFDDMKYQSINEEFNDMLRKGTTEHVNNDGEQVISPIFR